VPKTTTYEALEAELFSSPSMDVLRKFRALNPRRGQVKAGELIVLSDPNNQRCTYEESLLMSLSAEIHAEVANVSPEEADFTAEHHEQMQRLLDYGSKGVGVGEAMLGQHIAAIEKILKDIEQLHVRTFVMNGNLRSQDFMAERKLLLTQLDGRLGNLTRKGIGFPDHPKLKMPWAFPVAAWSITGVKPERREVFLAMRRTSVTLSGRVAISSTVVSWESRWAVWLRI
jgi:hypothetical protein